MSAIDALIAAVGGAASGASRGLGQIDEGHKQDQERRLQHQEHAFDMSQQNQHQLAQLKLQRETLDHQIAVAADEETHRKLVDHRAQVDQMIRSLSGMNINMADPERAYTYSQSHPNALGALVRAAGPASEGAAKRNVPFAPIVDPEADAMGGAGFDNKTYSPFVAMSANARAAGSVDKNKMTAIQNALTSVRLSKSNAYQSYAANPDQASLLKSVDPNIAETARQNAEKYATDQARASAAAELQGLRAVYGNDPDIAGMTVETLLGQVGGAAPNTNPLGLPPRGAAPRPPGAAAPAPAPAGNPADPLGFGTPRRVNPAAAPPTRPNVNPADPLGLRRPPVI